MPPTVRSSAGTDAFRVNDDDDDTSLWGRLLSFLSRSFFSSSFPVCCFCCYWCYYGTIHLLYQASQLIAFSTLTHVSKPGPPSALSVPAPPSMKSSPVPPNISSSPGPPGKTSLS